MLSQETHESILRLKKKHLGLLKDDAVGKLLSIATTATLHCVRPLEEHKPNKRFLFVEFLSCLLSHIQYLSHRVNLTPHREEHTSFLYGPYNNNDGSLSSSSIWCQRKDNKLIPLVLFRRSKRSPLFLVLTKLKLSPIYIFWSGLQLKTIRGNFLVFSIENSNKRNGRDAHRQRGMMKIWV